MEIILLAALLDILRKCANLMKPELNVGVFFLLELRCERICESARVQISGILTNLLCEGKVLRKHPRLIIIYRRSQIVTLVLKICFINITKLRYTNFTLLLLLIRNPKNVAPIHEQVIAAYFFRSKV